MDINIPGFGLVSLKHAVCDFNGTLAHEGNLLPGVEESLLKIGKLVKIHILTADTFGKVRTEIKNIPCELVILKQGKEDFQKGEYVESLGAKNVISYGNGNNDLLMLEAARIGVAVIEAEGCATKIFSTADIVVRNILEGLALLFNRDKLKATLRY